MLKNKKILSLIGLFILISLFSISCSSKQDPTGFRMSETVGTWTCSNPQLTGIITFSISSSGQLFIGGNSTYIPNWSPNTEVTSYYVDILFQPTSGSSTVARFTFTSANRCELTVPGYSMTDVFRK